MQSKRWEVAQENRVLWLLRGVNQIQLQQRGKIPRTSGEETRPRSGIFAGQSLPPVILHQQPHEEGRVPILQARWRDRRRPAHTVNGESCELLCLPPKPMFPILQQPSNTVLWNLAGWGVRSRPGRWGSSQAAALLALLRIHIYRLEFYMRFHWGKSSAAKKTEFEALYYVQCATWQVKAKPGSLSVQRGSD